MNTWNGMYKQGPVRYFANRKPACEQCANDCHRCNVAIQQIGDVIASIPEGVTNYEIMGPTKVWHWPVYRRTVLPKN